MTIESSISTFTLNYFHFPIIDLLTILSSKHQKYPIHTSQKKQLQQSLYFPQKKIVDSKQKEGTKKT
jgi:hypothetical protein